MLDGSRKPREEKWGLSLWGGGVCIVWIRLKHICGGPLRSGTFTEHELSRRIYFHFSIIYGRIRMNLVYRGLWLDSVLIYVS